MKKIRIGTRKSQLALWQADYVKKQLCELYSDLFVEIIGVTTTGDRLLSTSLTTEGGKGAFLKELEYALLDQSIDIAVHSMKDVPSNLPEGLHIPIICKREDARDAFISTSVDNISRLPKDSYIGTSSLRRQCLVLNLNPDLKVVPIRGNVFRRIEKLDEGEVDAIILAVAGLQRLGLDKKIKQIMPVENMLPAVGQGAIGIECAIENDSVNKIIQPLNHEPSRIRLQAERAGSALLQSGCHLPVAFYSELDGERLHLRGMVGMPDGSEVLSAEEIGLKNSPEITGKLLAQKLLDMGAGRILSYAK